MSIPGTFGELVAFILFLAPGVLWNQLRHSWKAPAERSTFQEISVVALFGTAFTSVSTAATLAVAHGINRVYYSNVENLLDGKTQLSAVGLTFPVVLAAVELVFSCLLVVVVFLFTRKGIYGPQEPQRTAWQQVLDDERPDGASAFGIVELVDGSEWRGEVVAHSLTGPPEDRYLILGTPIAFRDDPARSAPPQKLPYLRLVLPAERVSSLAVLYG
jgi:hypothetical protein